MRLQDWPNLYDTSYRETSLETIEYNCAAFAIGRTDIVVDSYGYWWPDDLVRDHKIESYAEFFKKYGFIETANGDLELGFDKICLFADGGGLFTHVAIQQSSGYWKSKMGDYEDIEHYTVNAVSGRLYGSPQIYMKRKTEKT
ncbi:MAG: hypothetical protein F9K22_12665 [Bacteroidetes bacterium]|nr:MAG: hypothetical protein F9K22_12665 [Bacteroidota bacterium]